MAETPRDPRESYTPLLRAFAEHLVSDLDKRIDQRLLDMEKLVFQRFELIETALNKADIALHTRLAGMNEFRDALKDQASQMATRTELLRVEETVNELRRQRANLDGRLAIIAAFISFLVAWLFRALTKS